MSFDYMHMNNVENTLKKYKNQINKVNTIRKLQNKQLLFHDYYCFENNDFYLFDDGILEIYIDRLFNNSLRFQIKNYNNNIQLIDFFLKENYDYINNNFYNYTNYYLSSYFNITNDMKNDIIITLSQLSDIIIFFVKYNLKLNNLL